MRRRAPTTSSPARSTASELLGYACYGPDAGNGSDVRSVLDRGAIAAAQGKGIGTSLVREVERGLRKRGRANVASSKHRPRSDYANTRAFYARRGYTEAARVSDFYAPADDRIIFTKRPAVALDRARSGDA